MPNGSTFSIVASTRSIAGTPESESEPEPGPNGYTDYKYLAAFMTDTSSNIQKFVHNYPSEFLFMTRGEDYAHRYGQDSVIGNFTGMQTLTRVPETAKAADVFLKLRLNTDTHAELSVGACRVWENGGYKSTEMTCRVGIENYSKSVEVNATGNRYTKTFFVLGYMDDLGL